MSAGGVTDRFSRELAHEIVIEPTSKEADATKGSEVEPTATTTVQELESVAMAVDLVDAR